MTDVLDPDLSICVDALGVTYSIAHEPISSFKEHMLRLLARRITYEDYNALQDITFSVQPDPISGMQCWHQRVRVENGESRVPPRP